MSPNNPFPGARYLHVSGHILVSYGPAEDAQGHVFLVLTDETFDAPAADGVSIKTGVVMSEAELASLTLILPIHARRGDMVVYKTGDERIPLVIGHIVDIVGEIALVKPVDGSNDKTCALDDLMVIVANSRPQNHNGYVDGQAYVLIENVPVVTPDGVALVLPRGVIVEINGTQPKTDFVAVNTADQGSFLIASDSLAPYDPWKNPVEIIGIVPDASSVPTGPMTKDQAIAMAADNNLFKADFVPYDVNHPEPTGACFSAEEVAVLNVLSEDLTLPTSMLGHAIYCGRRIPTQKLVEALKLSLPSSVIDAIPDIQEFFKEIGRITLAQTEEAARRIADWLSNGLDDYPDLDFEAPATIALCRVTNLTLEQIGELVSGIPLSAKDVTPTVKNLESREDAFPLERVTEILSTIFGDPVFVGHIDDTDALFDQAAAAAVEAGGPPADRLALYDDVTPTILEAAKGVRQDFGQFDKRLTLKLGAAVDHITHTGKSFAELAQNLSFIIDKTSDPVLKRSLRQLRQKVKLTEETLTAGVDEMKGIFKMRPIVDHLIDGINAIEADLSALVSLK